MRNIIRFRFHSLSLWHLQSSEVARRGEEQTKMWKVIHFSPSRSPIVLSFARDSLLVLSYLLRCSSLVGQPSEYESDAIRTANRSNSRTQRAGLLPLIPLRLKFIDSPQSVAAQELLHTPDPTTRWDSWRRALTTFDCVANDDCTLYKFKFRAASSSTGKIERHLRRRSASALPSHFP